VSDLVDGIYPPDGSSESTSPVNIGNPHEMTVLQFAETHHRDDRLVQPHHLQAAARRRPQVEKGLGLTIDHFRALIAAGRL
jgi:hypothetical protein